MTDFFKFLEKKYPTFNKVLQGYISSYNNFLSDDQSLKEYGATIIIPNKGHIDHLLNHQFEDKDDLFNYLSKFIIVDCMRSNQDWETHLNSLYNINNQKLNFYMLNGCPSIDNMYEMPFIALTVFGTYNIALYEIDKKTVITPSYNKMRKIIKKPGSRIPKKSTKLKPEALTDYNDKLNALLSRLNNSDSFKYDLLNTNKSLLYFLKTQYPNYYKSILHLISYEQIHTFFVLFEPFKESNKRLLPEHMIYEWFSKEYKFPDSFKIFNELQEVEQKSLEFLESLNELRENLYNMSSNYEELKEYMYCTYKNIVEYNLLQNKDLDVSNPEEVYPSDTYKLLNNVFKETGHNLKLFQDEIKAYVCNFIDQSTYSNIFSELLDIIKCFPHIENQELSFYDKQLFTKYKKLIYSSCFLSFPLSDPTSLGGIYCAYNNIKVSDELNPDNVCNTDIVLYKLLCKLENINTKKQKKQQMHDDIPDNVSEIAANIIEN